MIFDRFNYVECKAFLAARQSHKLMFPADVAFEDRWWIAADDLMLARDGRSQQCACRHDGIIRHLGTFQQNAFTTHPDMVTHQDGLVGVDAFVII